MFVCPTSWQNFLQTWTPTVCVTLIAVWPTLIRQLPNISHLASVGVIHGVPCGVGQKSNVLLALQTHKRVAPECNPSVRQPLFFPEHNARRQPPLMSVLVGFVVSDQRAAKRHPKHDPGRSTNGSSSCPSDDILEGLYKLRIREWRVTRRKLDLIITD